MIQVKITNGIYGYRPPKSKQLKPAHAGDIITVQDKEAARLIELGVAVSVDSVSVVSDELDMGKDTTINSPDGGDLSDFMPGAPVL